MRVYSRTNDGDADRLVVRLTQWNREEWGVLEQAEVVLLQVLR